MVMEPCGIRAQAVCECSSTDRSRLWCCPFTLLWLLCLRPHTACLGCCLCSAELADLRGGGASALWSLPAHVSQHCNWGTDAVTSKPQQTARPACQDRVVPQTSTGVLALTRMAWLSLCMWTSGSCNTRSQEWCWLQGTIRRRRHGPVCCDCRYTWSGIQFSFLRR